jgi:hypothetical protein
MVIIFKGQANKKEFILREIFDIKSSWISHGMMVPFKFNIERRIFAFQKRLLSNFSFTTSYKNVKKNRFSNSLMNNDVPQIVTGPLISFLI